MLTDLARERRVAFQLLRAGAIVVTVVLLVPQAALAQSTAGLIAAYGFGEGIGVVTSDATGNNHQANITGATWTTGRFGTGLSFDGINDLITIADAPDLDLSTGMTLMAWVRPTAHGAGVWRNVVIKEDATREVYNLYSNTDANAPSVWAVVASAPDSPQVAAGTSQLPLNTWSHLAATYDGVTLRLYVNGSQVANRPLAGALKASTGPLRIGGNSLWGEFFQGIIDEVRIYNRALTGAEIATDMDTPVPSASPPASAAQVGQWSGVMSWPLVAVHMTLLRTGDVLVWDGQEFGHDAYVWNPITEAFLPVPSEDSNLFCAGHAVLADGRVAVVGGHLGSHVGIRDINSFDPTTATWGPLPPMSFGRWYPTVTVLADGRLLTLSGDMDCEGCVAEIPEVYDPVTRAWTSLPAARLSLPLYPHMFVLPDGRVLNTGSAGGPVPTRILNVGTQTWTTVDPTMRDSGSAVMYLPGKVLKSGTSSVVTPIAVVVTPDTFVLDATQPSPTWRQTAPMAIPRTQHNLTVLPDGSVLATGGSRHYDVFDVASAALPAEIWSPVTETWSTMASMFFMRHYHSSALLLADGRVLVAGGGRPGLDQHTAEIFYPPYLFRGPRPTIASAPLNTGYGVAFMVQTPDAQRIASVSLVRPGSVTHSFDQDQRFVPLTFQRVGADLQVQAPASPAVAPPGYYMFFILDTNGSPSVASFVQLTQAAADEERPTPPGNLTALGSAGSVQLSWQASSDNVGVTAYNVHRATSAGFVVAPANRIAQTAQTTYTDSELGAGTYFYRVTAQDAPGNVSDPSNEASATITTSTGLVAAYGFNEGSGSVSADRSGKGHQAVITGATWTTAGRFGAGLSFDGVNDWVTIADAPDLDFTTGMTLMAWVRPTAAGSGVWRNVIIKEDGSREVYNLYSKSNTNAPSTWVTLTSGPTSPKGVYGPAQVPLNAWTHLATTYDGVTLRLFVNGAEVANRAVSGSIKASAGVLRIGGNSIWGEFFKGVIDEVRVYNRTLTSGQIQSDMATPVP